MKPLVRYRWAFVLACCVVWLIAPRCLAGGDGANPPNTLKTDPFAMKLDPQRLLQPGELAWMPHGFALLDSAEPLTFAPAMLPRDSADGPKLMASTATVITADSWVGLAVDIALPYAELKRVIWLHEDQPRVRIDDHYTFTTDEAGARADDVAVTLAFNPAFTRRRTVGPAEGEQLSQVVMHAAAGNPTLLSDPHTQTHLLVCQTAMAAQAEATPARVRALKNGDRLHLSAELILARGDDAKLVAMLKALSKSTERAADQP